VTAIPLRERSSDAETHDGIAVAGRIAFSGVVLQNEQMEAAERRLYLARRVSGFDDSNPDMQKSEAECPGPLIKNSARVPEGRLNFLQGQRFHESFVARLPRRISPAFALQWLNENPL
jgi:hypothetical protein